MIDFDVYSVPKKKVVRWRDFTADDICLDDWARALCGLRRFQGRGVPVAQHCLHVARLVPDYLRIHALLHDAEEALTGDINGPIKEAMPGVDSVGERYKEMVYSRFGLSYDVLKPGSATLLECDLWSGFLESRYVWEGGLGLDTPQEFLDKVNPSLFLSGIWDEALKGDR